ncbi:MAG: hypothetical protein K2M78_16115 [Lachnospiraceae bacterium]|nr:hypothetical protein [Lachnospiraceae bacterium]
MGLYIIGFLFVGYSAFYLIGTGISQIKSKKPVGFYTGQKPPEASRLTDVKKWNAKHGTMWIIYGIAMIFSFLATFYLGDSICSALIICVVFLGGILLMVLYHERLKKKFMK